MNIKKIVKMTVMGYDLVVDESDVTFVNDPDLTKHQEKTIEQIARWRYENAK